MAICTGNYRYRQLKNAGSGNAAVTACLRNARQTLQQKRCNSSAWIHRENAVAHRHIQAGANLVTTVLGKARDDSDEIAIYMDDVAEHESPDPRALYRHEFQHEIMRSKRNLTGRLYRDITCQCCEATPLTCRSRDNGLQLTKGPQFPRHWITAGNRVRPASNSSGPRHEYPGRLHVPGNAATRLPNGD